jgi:hypothetical protein
VKKCSRLFVATLLLACIYAPLTALGDAPTCGPDGCSKPGVRAVAPQTPPADAPTCGPDGCTKPGLV